MLGRRGFECRKAVLLVSLRPLSVFAGIFGASLVLAATRAPTVQEIVPQGETRRARARRRPRRERRVNRAVVFWGMEGFEKEARGGQARREPAAFQITGANFGSRVIGMRQAGGR